MKRLLVVGLGLIGGSMALALRGFEGFELVGADRSEETLSAARARGVCDRVTHDAAGELGGADLVILCLHPQGILDFLEAHARDFRPGALVIDVCGVKGAVMDTAARVLPPQVSFIGCHPMAGKEHSGIAHADGALFQNAHFIITPPDTARDEHLALLGRMATHMGFRDVVHTTAARHDAIIAYTSQVMHIMAVAVCDDSDLFECKGFEGGSFRDCTRVAALDVPLWTELFSLNRDALCAVIARLEENLGAYRTVLEAGDTARLSDKLASSASRKRAMHLE